MWFFAAMVLLVEKQNRRKAKKAWRFLGWFLFWIIFALAIWAELNGAHR
ncbi:hypothetical protein SAMN05421507_108146 [Lentzea jiangxiensis]|uniref:Uncharacterized protein n=1 Tax=Lentzea jiangxiensis TaxID=641025 RepID=A0A1H0SME0_9PSEU|nr:hypothetical protein SAMN05421507_108146 [Lentzea jiangxiensis]